MLHQGTREREIIELILRTGLAPKILRRKQMVLLPKTPNVDPTLDVSKGLPPRRPITFVDGGIPRSLLQHGFRSDRSVIDAALMTTLLIERAKVLKELLLLVSKDCLKCYDRIPAWVIELIYLGLGVPDTVKKLMIDLLGPGEIEVRASFGWIATGEREFGIEQLEKCVDPVVIRHSQKGHGINIASTMFVDDQLDVTASYNGRVDRARVTNMFTGKFATGGPRSITQQCT
ncbi:uncharacterized protein PITG_00240 [Phytophthora infestans T30-4]|uniref:Reverse transcriptase domain-containing protein n=1 Tax=Phytophthora infestans (strain T30-4) TaxID=403677 RepID=D0MQA8_PHYIT|nr:uncharacterized protein PITG_00240 [Phytophthora infestans T30-4]EEY57677.1 conserved hypothetical protein [Phytophthora infestans T30-4]|eukprot:XP_002908863.1 conserved hypothetical protein [Phytophthora infestans T30-4]